jgi:hypothetical protein
MANVLPQEVVEQVNALIDAKINQRIEESTRVMLGTALTEFERLYMQHENRELLTETFRKFLRWQQATLDGRINAIIDERIGIGIPVVNPIFP